MTTGEEPIKVPETDLGKLDALIEKSYRDLITRLKDNVKLGDFIKMIETRRKLAPSEDDQSAFWDMLEHIRQKSLDTSGPEEK